MGDIYMLEYNSSGYGLETMLALVLKFDLAGNIFLNLIQIRWMEFRQKLRFLSTLIF